MARVYNLFVSHSWSYADDYERLVGLLDGDPRFQYRNYSIPRDDPVHDANTQELYDAIFDRVRFCHAVIIMAGKYATFSKWISREISIAQREFNESKPIIAVRPLGNMQVSSAVRDNADALVNWSTTSIVSAIRQLAI